MKRYLTPTAAKCAKPKIAPYKLADGGGLYLLVNPSGTKLWRYKLRLAGKELTYSLGKFPELGLAQARIEHEKARQLVAMGISPVYARKAMKKEQVAATANSFEAVAKKWIGERSPLWSSYYKNQVETTLKRDVYPIIGKLNVKDVTASHLRPIIKTVATRTLPPDGKRERTRGASTVAILIRQWCSAIFRHGVANGVADHDPTYAIRDLVIRPKVQHHRHLVDTELAPFMKVVRNFTGTQQVKIAIELLLLTFVRTGELRNAEWTEIDFKKALWRIPAHKMKMGREHLVPLSSRALELLDSLQLITGNERYLFPNQRTPSKVMSMTTINRALERMGYGGRLSGHGFRGTASTYLNEVGYTSRIIEKQLAHDKKNSVEAAYNHAQYLDERTKMMEQWCNFVIGGHDNVVPIKKLAGA